MFKVDGTRLAPPGRHKRLDRRSLVSIQCMMHVWWNSLTSGNDRLVLLAIADEADDEGQNAFPSVRRVAEKVNCHTATVLRCIVNLERANELEVVRPLTRGRGRLNKYKILMAPIPTPDEIRARYEPVDKNDRKPRPLRENARIEPDKRAHTALEMRAPMRANPITRMDPRGLKRFQFGSVPERREGCTLCNYETVIWTGENEAEPCECVLRP